ncbi:MAG: pyridoxal-phosphate dependent enzyme [Bryobacteraceae bacterium]
MWKYHRLLPVRDLSKIVTLGEGNTPLTRARNGHGVELFLKNETVNPTGSHKDRALSIAMTKAAEFGFDACMLYSDGSAALSSAAYAARAGMRNIALVPQGSPDNRLLPLMVYDSIVLEYIGPAAEALEWAHAACQELKLYETTTYQLANPYQSEGPKTIAYEILDQLGAAPDWCLVPVGGGGTLAGVWRGFCDLRDRGKITKLPKLAGILPQHYILLQTGLDNEVTTDLELRSLGRASSGDESAPHTAQAKLAMAFPPDGIEAIAAIRGSGGLFLNVSDAEAFAAQLELGSTEGIYVEISAAVSVAALKRLRENGMIKSKETVVVLLCGSGFRETGELARTLPVRKLQVDRHSGMDMLAHVVKGL